MTSRVVETSEARNDAQKAARARARAAETDQDRQKRLAAMRDSYKKSRRASRGEPWGPTGGVREIAPSPPATQAFRAGVPRGTESCGTFSLPSPLGKGRDLDRGQDPQDWGRGGGQDQSRPRLRQRTGPPLGGSCPPPPPPPSTGALRGLEGGKGIEGTGRVTGTERGTGP